jgi:uncharacterized protein YdbL (DUF1318 family)
MPRLSHRAKIIVIFIVILILGSGLFAFLQAQSKVPTSFTQARAQGAIIAQNIVTLSDQSTANLEKVNQYDKEGDYTDALTLTTTVAGQSQQLRDQAVELSNQVSDMTQALSSISSFPAQQAALEAISSRLALINELVNYSGDLGKLLDVLRAHFTGQSQNDTQVQALVNQINTDVNAINNFNAQANASMNQFDKLMGQ